MTSAQIKGDRLKGDKVIPAILREEVYTEGKIHAGGAA
jgi:hypothetical protein